MTPIDTLDENTRSFIAECRDMLEDVEPRLIELERHYNELGEVDEDTVNTIFRLFHSLKGSAGFFQFSTIVGVTHSAETLLDLFRSGQSQLGPQHTEVLCRTCDLVHVLLDQVENTGVDTGLELEADEVIKELAETISREEGRTVETCSEPSSEAPNIEIQLPGDDVESEPGTGHEPAAEESAEPPSRPSGDENDLVARFAQESEELIDQAEQALLGLEKKPDHTDLQKEAFRALHSLKGNCGFMGLGDMERLAHGMENVLGAAVDGVIQASRDNIPTLLYIIDLLRSSVSDFAGGGSGQVENCGMFLDMLQDLIPPEAVKSLDDVPGPAPTFTVDEAAGRTDSPAATGPAQPGASEDQRVKEPQAAWLLRNTETPPPARENGEAKAQAGAPASFKPRSGVRQDIRVDLSKLDLLINLVGEMVIAESMVTRNPDLEGYEFENFERAAAHLQKIVRDLQDVALSVRMIPIGGIFRKMIRLVHDLSVKANKKIELTLLGEDTEIDKTVAELIADPLVHLVRNSVDHGIETPEKRRAAGKDETGNLVIEAKHEGGEVWVLIRDDGRGLSRDKILKKALERDLVKAKPEEMTDNEVYNLIFEPGFSTADQVTDISGRGVGMDVVKKNIEKIKGTVDVFSQPGLGATFVLRIPLTLAIMEGMLVRVGSTLYSIPLLAIRESIQVQPHQIHRTMDNQEIVKVREELLPVLRLHELHRIEPEFTDLTQGLLIILESQGEALAMFVDEIMGEQQTVIKGLSGYMGEVRGVSGCTILGNGEVSLILDVGGLVDLALGKAKKRAASLDPRTLEAH
jgi:two-component system chemotaxis sensor kinase CheA